LREPEVPGRSGCCVGGKPEKKQRATLAIDATRGTPRSIVGARSDRHLAGPQPFIALVAPEVRKVHRHASRCIRAQGAIE